MTRTRGDRHWYTSRAFWACVGVGCAASLSERDEKAGMTDALMSGVLDGLIFLGLARASRTVASSVRSALPALVVHSTRSVPRS